MPNRKVRDKNYYETNRDNILIKKKSYYQANKVKIDIKHKIYNKINKTKVLHQATARIIRWQCRMRSEHRCVICGVAHSVEYKNSLGESKNNFRRVKVSDTIKENFCKSNNIEMLIIPYLEYNNIEKIVYSFLKSKGGL